jgi:hypothetical protein
MNFISSFRLFIPLRIGLTLFAFVGFFTNLGHPSPQGEGQGVRDLIRFYLYILVMNTNIRMT